MRLHGWCTECRRVRLVLVSGHALIRSMAQGSQVPEGICSECEEAQRNPQPKGTRR